MSTLYNQATESGDSSWEDEGSCNQLRDGGLSRHPNNLVRSARNTRQKPKHKRQRAHLATTYRKRASLRLPGRAPPKPPRRTKEGRAAPSMDRLLRSAQKFTTLNIRYTWDDSGRTFRRLHYLLPLWILALICLRSSPTIWGTVAPVCYLPIISSPSLCRTSHSMPVPEEQASQYADDLNIAGLQNKQSKDDPTGGSESTEIKTTEMGITDLVTLVRFSKLKAKYTLLGSLIGFVKEGRKVGQGLQTLSSNMGGVIDNIMAVNDHALEQMDAAHKNQPSSLYALIPWKSPRKSINEVVVDTFGEAMNIFSTHMQHLIIEAEANIIALDALEERMSTLHVIISREDVALSSEKEDLLLEIWTILGLNRKALRDFDQSLMLLTELRMYRKQALARVVAALQSLRAMSADMEDLRERVARPALASSKISVEIHMKSIKLGLERLREGRVRAKELDEVAMRQVFRLSVDD